MKAQRGMARAAQRTRANLDGRTLIPLRAPEAAARVGSHRCPILRPQATEVYIQNHLTETNQRLM